MDYENMLANVSHRLTQEYDVPITFTTLLELQRFIQDGGMGVLTEKDQQLLWSLVHLGQATAIADDKFAAIPTHHKHGSLRVQRAYDALQRAFAADYEVAKAAANQAYHEVTKYL